MNLRNNTIISTLSLLYRIFDKKQRSSFVRLLLLTFAGSVADLAGLSLIIPVISIMLSDSFYHSVSGLPFFTALSKEQILLYSIIVFFIIIVAKNLFLLYIHQCQARFVNGVYVSSSLRMFDIIYNRPLAEVLVENSNSLVSRLSSKQTAFGSSIVLPILVIMNELIVFALMSLWVCIWNWRLLLLLAAILGPTIGLFYYKVKQTIRKAGAEKIQGMIDIHAESQNMIFGYSDIKIAGTQNSFRQRFQKLVNNFGIHQKKTDFLMFVPSKIIEVGIFLCAVVILLYCIYILKDTTQLVATTSMFFILAYRLTPSLNRIVMAVNNINTAAYIQNEPDFWAQPSSGVPQQGITFSEKLCFKNITYRYPGEMHDVLHNCSFEINKGSTTGIIGKSGAGKSTLIRLILGFLQPSAGEIWVDNDRLSEHNTGAWWKLLGYVRQDVFIMNASLMENIALGESAEQIDRERLHRAIDAASLSEFVNSKKEGIHAILSEWGNNLSGGQKQRIAIARALYKGAQILVFDEATSSLDMQTEQEITNAIHRLGKEQLTIIIIAHRHTSLKYCDNILLLENGVISRSYTYSSLVASYSDKD